ncbi:hypothetical protein CsatB_014129 [Cannabis sativa]
MVPNENVSIENQNESVDVENRGDVPIENINVENNSDVSFKNDNMENQNHNTTNSDGDHLNNSLKNEDVLEDNDDNNAEQSNPLEHLLDIFDPKNWDALDSKMIDLLVLKGPKRDYSVMSGSKTKFSRRFTANLYTRVLSNGEKCDRDWLVYSKELDRVFCFCCKVFKSGIGRGMLTNESFSDWAHIGERLKEHEISMKHVKYMTT